jgi:hypothetical protein
MSESLSAALLAFQASHVEIQKTAVGHHLGNKYVPLEDLLPEVIPALNRCGLVVLQMPTHVDGQPALTTKIIHAATGESVSSTMLLLVAKPDPQGQGSAITYARRYSLMAMLGLVADEDTDDQPRKPKSKRLAGGGGEPPSEGGPPPVSSDLVSEAQRKRLFALAKANDVSSPTLKLILERVTGQGSTAGITKAMYDAVCEAVVSHDALEAAPFE